MPLMSNDAGTKWSLPALEERHPMPHPSPPLSWQLASLPFLCRQPRWPFGLGPSWAWRGHQMLQQPLQLPLQLPLQRPQERVPAPFALASSLTRTL